MYERTYRARALSKQDEPSKKKRRRGRLPLPGKRARRAVLAAVVAAGLALLIRWPTLQVKTIDVVGTKVADPEDVVRFVQSQIAGDYAYVLPKASMLLVPTASIAKWTKRQFPRFETVDVRRKGVDGLIVTVDEYDGTSLWCERDDACFFMTDDGIVFAPAPIFSGDAYIKIFVGAPSALPFTPLSADEQTLIAALIDRLPSIGIAPAEFHGVSDHELDVYFTHFGQHARLMIDPSIDGDAMLEDLATGLETDPLKTLFHSERQSLEYLDARFANKVIYKFK